MQAPEVLPPAERGMQTPEAAGATITPLTLEVVTQSAATMYPGLEAALREMDIAQGKETSAWGEFDLKAKADSIAGPMGFYKNYRTGVKLEQATMPGGLVYGQYRIGDGSFPTWYGERETNEGGEFKVGYLASLLQGRAIDPRRAAIFQAQLRQEQVEPAVQVIVLDIVFAASDVYWSWVAAGASRRVQQNLLDFTRERNRIYEIRVQNKDLAPIELVQNERLLASRQAKLYEAERKLQQSAIKLSLFLRDPTGRGVVPSAAALPRALVRPKDRRSQTVEEDIALAQSSRPELRELNVIQRQVELDRQLATNQTLPSLDAGFDASKDVGAQASSKGDKTPFELEAGLYFEMPLQRRKAYGKIREADGKLAQLGAKRRLTEDKIAIEVRDAVNAIQLASDRARQTEVGVRTAKELVDAERLRLDNGDSDLLRVAIQEASAIEAELADIEALADYWKAEAALRAALGILPP